MATETGTIYWLGRLLTDAKLDPTECLLMIGLADHVDDNDECFVGIDKLAEYARVSYATARRRLTKLEEVGRLERTRRRRTDGNLSTYTWRLVRTAPSPNLSGDHRPPGRAVTTAHHDERAEVPSVEPPSGEEPLGASAPGDGCLDLGASVSEQSATSEAQATRATAERLLRSWWDARSPRPTQNYPGARKVIGRLLDAGWTEEQLGRALPSTPIITAAACELALRRNAAPVAAAIDTDRDGAAGEWLADASVPGGWRLAVQA